MTTGPERRRKMSEISGKTSIDAYCMLPVHQEHHNNNLLTESEGSMGKYQTEVLLYWPSDSEVNTARPRFDIFPYCPN